MERRAKILAIAGSLRKDSVNKKIAKAALKAAEADGAEVEFIDLADYPMPLYDGDIETAKGIPENGLRLKAKMEEADGFIFASPEYNSSFSAALKNVIDWASRQKDQSDKPLSSFKGKTALLLSASPGALGGLRGLVHLRSLLGNIGVYVLPDQKAFSDSFNLFDHDGRFKEAKDQEAVDRLAKTLVDVTAKLKH